MRNPDSAFLEEGAATLFEYGIKPIENAHYAVVSIWDSLLTIARTPVTTWAEASEWLEHPQLQATLGYYKAMGRWRLRCGLPAIPGDLPEGVTELPPRHALPEVMPVFLEVAADNRMGLPVLVLKGAMLDNVVREAKVFFDATRGYGTPTPLMGYVKEVALAIKTLPFDTVELQVPGLGQNRTQSKRVLFTWIHGVRDQPDIKGLKVYFKFD